MEVTYAPRSDAAYRAHLKPEEVEQMALLAELAKHARREQWRILRRASCRARRAQLKGLVEEK